MGGAPLFCETTVHVDLENWVVFSDWFHLQDKLKRLIRHLNFKEMAKKVSRSEEEEEPQPVDYGKETGQDRKILW